MQKQYLAEDSREVCRLASNRFTKLPTNGTLQESSADSRSTYHKELTEIDALKGKESTFSGSTHINYQEVYIANKLLHF